MEELWTQGTSKEKSEGQMGVEEWGTELHNSWVLVSTGVYQWGGGCWKSSLSE